MGFSWNSSSASESMREGDSAPFDWQHPISVTGEWVSRAAVGAGEAHGDVRYCELRVGVGAGATILGEAPRTRLLLMWREGHPCLCQINL